MQDIQFFCEWLQGRDIDKLVIIAVCIYDCPVKENYQFTWPDKKKSVLLANQNPPSVQERKRLF